MNNKLYISKYLLCLLIIVTFFVGCKKEEDLGTAPRLFAPFTEVETFTNLNAIKATWTKIEGASTFTVDLSLDTFKTIYKTLDTDSITCTLTNLDWDKNYQLRVKCNGTNISSKYFGVGNIIVPDYPTLLKSIPASDIIDNAVYIRWTNDATPFTKLVFTKVSDGTTKEVSLTSTDLTNGYKLVSGLTPGSNYIASIYTNDTYRGKKKFATVAAAVYDNPVDLRAIDDATATSMLTTAYLASLAPGSTVILKPGLTYTIGSVAIGQSVMFISGLGFGDYAKFDMQGGSFTPTSGSNIGFIKFKNINLIGNSSSYGTKYLMNINAASTIGKIIADGCKMRCLRSIVRNQSTSATLDSAIFNNCLIDSIREYAVVYSTSYVKNIKMTNSTVSYAQKLFLNNKFTTNSVDVENCTFYYTPTGSATGSLSYLFDFSGQTVTNGIIVKNCIFGPGGIPYNAPQTSTAICGYRGTNINVTSSGNFMTSDCSWLQDGLPDVTTYSGAASALFTDPAKNNFKINDSKFVGKSTAGDPRWRP